MQLNCIFCLLNCVLCGHIFCAITIVPMNLLFSFIIVKLSKTLHDGKVEKCVILILYTIGDS